MKKWCIMLPILVTWYFYILWPSYFFNSTQEVLLEYDELAKKAIEPLVKVVSDKCHPSYSGCLKIDAGDYDCVGGSGNGPNYTGTVRVFGLDEFDLDRDEDGAGCE